MCDLKHTLTILENMWQTPTELNHESNRLTTFKNWDLKSPVAKENLARQGFYYTKDHDIVKCYFCEVEIGQWSQDDDVFTEHKRWSPHCPFLTSHTTTDNFPIDSISLNQELTERRSVDECGSKPFFADYSIEQNRFKSFEKNWPKHLKQTPEQLSEAGFFFFYEFDQCKCFSCGGGLKDWEEDNDPWEQHALWYGNCQYVNLIKGKAYIDEIKRKNDSKEKEGSLNNEKSFNTVINNDGKKTIEINIDQHLCKICYSNAIEVVFTPCMHIISCIKCSLSVLTCPICREEIKDIKRVYF